MTYRVKTEARKAHLGCLLVLLIEFSRGEVRVGGEGCGVVLGTFGCKWSGGVNACGSA